MVDKIARLGVSRAQVTRIIRQIAADSAKVAFTQETAGREWDLVINRLQIIACLKKGEVTTDPVMTPQGYVECGMDHFSAGQDIHVEIAIRYDDASNRYLVVRSVTRE